MKNNMFYSDKILNIHKQNNLGVNDNDDNIGFKIQNIYDSILKEDIVGCTVSNTDKNMRLIIYLKNMSWKYDIISFSDDVRKKFLNIFPPKVNFIQYDYDEFTYGLLSLINAITSGMVNYIVLVNGVVKNIMFIDDYSMLSEIESKKDYSFLTREIISPMKKDYFRVRKVNQLTIRHYYLFLK